MLIVKLICMLQLFYLFIALAVCITIHEASHAWTAYKLGDPTAKIAGRVTLNPLKHLDLLGTIMIFIAHFGWGKPTPFNYYNLKHPRRDSALIAIAGPISNLLTAFVIAILFKYFTAMPELIFRGLKAIFDLSIILAWFNVIPIAPLDGSKLLGLVIPASKENWYQNFLSKGPVLILALIIGDLLMRDIVGFSVFGTYLQYTYELTITGLLLVT